MSGSHPSRWIIFIIAGALSALGCVGSTDTGGQGETGSLSLDLVLADDIEIARVDWQISGNDMDMSGAVDVSAPGSTASVEVFGLPPGQEDYTVELTAISTDEAVTCRGSADFNVEVGQSTDVMVMLNCKKPRTLGGVRVNGKFNICTQLTKVVVSPLQTSVGNDISLGAQAHDEEGDAIAYSWTGSGGSIADPTAAMTTYTCTEVGNHSVTIMVTDNDEYCRMATWTVPVTCVEGDVVDLCEGVMCEDDGNDCTATECNPANGQCETSNVDDGTACYGGTCSSGVCVEDNLCDGVDCNDDNECTADACDPADGSCSNMNVDNGTPCNDGTGMCSDGVCMDDNLCDGVVCDDTGNDCTVAMCNNSTGQCETMNVTDGTACNGGAGACSAGECIDASLCDDVDCTSSNDCVMDGACDPATGDCIAGDNQPVDTACASNGGTVCDGAGNCVVCNAAGQCPDDGNECTAAACEGNACVQNNVTNGQVCDFGGSDGICEAGTCVEAPQCTGPGDCDDGNACTAGSCPDGMCVYTPVADGTTCDVSPGVPGTCTAGDCVGLCDNVDCTSANDCIQDGTCDPASGQCQAGDPEAIDTTCASSGGSFCDGAGNCVECNSDAQCASGQTCTDNSCVSGSVDPPAVTQDIGLACNNSAQPQMSTLPATLTVDPGPLAGGAAFTANLTGNLNFPESFLDVATTVLPAGTTSAQIAGLQATVEVRSGATGADVAIGVDPTIPESCALTGTACDSANGVNGNPACLAIALDTCGPSVDLPLSTDATTCEDLGKTSQLTNFGGCITGDLPLPLGDATGNYTAAASGDVLFGWLDDLGTAGSVIKSCPDAGNDECYSTNASCELGEVPTPVCAYDGPYADGTNDYISIPQPLFPDAIGPLGLKVNAGLLVAIECVMGADISRPECNGLCDNAANLDQPCENDDDCDGTVDSCGNPDEACDCQDVTNCGSILGATPDGDLIGFTIP